MKNLIMTCLALAVCANMSGQKLPQFGIKEKG